MAKGRPERRQGGRAWSGPQKLSPASLKKKGGGLLLTLQDRAAEVLQAFLKSDFRITYKKHQISIIENSETVNNQKRKKLKIPGTPPLRSHQ